jgi:GNAT superfamily N-acetyltransferase
VTIRPARPDDAPELAALAGELGYPSTAAELARRLAPLLADPAQAVLVAVDDADRAVGWTHVVVRRQLDSDDWVEVAGLVVTEGQRGAGVGAALLVAAERWAVAHSLPLVQLRSNVIRERAHRFYRRQGYEPVKSQLLFRRRVDGTTI